jgi:hypothetical protein
MPASCRSTAGSGSWIRKSKNLSGFGIGLKSSKRLGNIRTPAFVGGKKINPETTLRNIAGDIPFMYVRNWSKCLIYVLE